MQRGHGPLLTCNPLAHQDAYEQAQVLHRDISARNVMINPLNDKALLIDWDLAKYMDVDQGIKSNQGGRSVSASRIITAGCI